VARAATEMAGGSSACSMTTVPCGTTGLAPNSGFGGNFGSSGDSAPKVAAPAFFSLPSKPLSFEKPLETATRYPGICLLGPSMLYGATSVKVSPWTLSRYWAPAVGRRPNIPIILLGMVFSPGPIGLTDRG
jgi:hypothetical protein